MIISFVRVNLTIKYNFISILKIFLQKLTIRVYKCLRFCQECCDFVRVNLYFKLFIGLYKFVDIKHCVLNMHIVVGRSVNN